TERTLWALGRPAEDQSVADRHQVTQLLQILRVGGRLRHDEAVLVGRRGVVEDGETFRIERFLETDLGRLRIRGRLSDLPVLVDEGEERREVLGVNIDLAGLDRGLDELTVPEVEFPCDLVPVRVEYLAVQLAERDLLVEVGRADDDVWPCHRRSRSGCRSRCCSAGAAAASRVSARARHYGDRDEGGDQRSSALHVGSSPAVA